MDRKIAIAVVGCGYWGPNLIRNFSALPQCLVRYVCDKDGKRLAHMKQLYPQVEATADFGKVVGDGDVNAVVVATPVHLHYELAKKSLEAGKHVFVEKPMTQTSEQGNDLVQLAAKKKLTLMVGHTFIYSAPVRRIREIVRSGDIGEIQYISSRRLNLGLFQKDINVAWDLAPHDISIILHLLGTPPISVNCQGKAHINKDIEDVTNMSLNFDNGGFATIHSSWLDPNKVREMVIVGSKRMIVYDDNQPLEKIKIYDKRVETPPHYDTFAEFQYSYHYGDMYAPYIKQVEPLKVECQHFLDSILSGKMPDTSGLDGLRVIQILEASSRSLKNGGAKVEIDRTLGAVPAPA
ncbi:Gfo/Idh/MocA family protein [Candidatus Deferrimicrobium sp.]|uniref:Gfo/Idh/MocA family protein n=1 Tax=Candidatus Deferrimicrobium sp. TaxID=3060586 RepID=UPI003C366036